MSELYHNGLPPEFYSKDIFGKLTPSAVWVYLLIKSRCDKRGIARMELTYIQRRCCIGRVTMHSALNELAACGLLKDRIKPRFTYKENAAMKKLGREQSNFWIFVT